jgi:hypothetical protein
MRPKLPPSAAPRQREGAADEKLALAATWKKC